MVAIRVIILAVAVSIMLIMYNHYSIFGEYNFTVDSKVHTSRILNTPSLGEYPGIRNNSSWDMLHCVCLEFLLDGSSETRCNPIDSFNNTIMHCRDFSGKGFFQIQSNSSVGHVGAFMRLNGPMIDTVLFEPVGQNGRVVWRSNYSICRAGNYSGAIYIYLSDTTPETILLTGCLDSSFDKPIVFNWIEESASTYCSSIWYWNNNTYDDELSLYRVPVRSDYVSAYTGLRNTLPSFEFSDLKQQNGDICMYGDSQMRNLLNSIGGQVNQNTCFPLLQQEYKGDCEVDGFRWKGFRYPHEWSFESDMAGCSQVFVNFGQWPAGWPSKPTPWNFARYRTAVHDFIAILTETLERHPHLRITWVDTNPHPVMSFQTACPPTDWRLPHVLAAYNRIAREEVLATNGYIGFLETFSVTFPLFDLSFDMAHYQGPVGVALANVMAGILLQL
jgi:hypothetical protein